MTISISDLYVQLCLTYKYCASVYFWAKNSKKSKSKMSSTKKLPEEPVPGWENLTNGQAEEGWPLPSNMSFCTHLVTSWWYISFLGSLHSLCVWDPAPVDRHSRSWQGVSCQLVSDWSSFVFPCGIPFCIQWRFLFYKNSFSIKLFCRFGGWKCLKQPCFHSIRVRKDLINTHTDKFVHNPRNTVP